MKRRVAVLLRRGLAWRSFYLSTDLAGRFFSRFLAVASLLVFWETLRPSPVEQRRAFFAAAVLAAAWPAVKRLGRTGLSRRKVARDLGSSLPLP